MKTFLIVIAMIAPPGATDTDLYVIQEPNFQYPQQCLQFVKSNTFPLLRKAKSVYPTQDVDNIYCITKEKLKVLVSGSNV
tara:strand:+ start:97 stop:336 length:240 start_codon:yes stop_codon:yes gene_type:complete